MRAEKVYPLPFSRKTEWHVMRKKVVCRLLFLFYFELSMCTREPHIWHCTFCQCLVWRPDGNVLRYWLWQQKHGTAFTSVSICAKIETMSSPTGTGGTVGSGGQPNIRKLEKKAREYRKGKKTHLIKRN